MKSNKSLIIQLLLSDMKQEQLIAGLNRLGFKTDLHGSGLSQAVAGLFGIAASDIGWHELYMACIEQAPDYDITGDGKNLLPLAESCYTQLLQLAGTHKA